MNPFLFWLPVGLGLIVLMVAFLVDRRSIRKANLLIPHQDPVVPTKEESSETT